MMHKQIMMEMIIASPVSNDFAIFLSELLLLLLLVLLLLVLLLLNCSAGDRCATERKLSETFP